MTTLNKDAVQKALADIRSKAIPANQKEAVDLCLSLNRKNPVQLLAQCLLGVAIENDLGEADRLSLGQSYRQAVKYYCSRSEADFGETWEEFVPTFLKTTTPRNKMYIEDVLERAKEKFDNGNIPSWATEMYPNSPRYHAICTLIDTMHMDAMEDAENPIFSLSESKAKQFLELAGFAVTKYQIGKMFDILQLEVLETVLKGTPAKGRNRATGSRYRLKPSVRTTAETSDRELRK